MIWGSTQIQADYLCLVRYKILVGYYCRVIVMLALLLSLALSFLDILPFSSVYLGWNGFEINNQIWTIVLLLVAAGLATWFRFSQNDLAFPLVFIWTLIGVGVQNQSDYPLVSSSAYIVVDIIVVMMFLARKKIMLHKYMILNDLLTHKVCYNCDNITIKGCE